MSDETVNSSQRARHIYQTCLDWHRDTGDCHFCTTKPPDNQHDPECPMVAELDAEAAALEWLCLQCGAINAACDENCAWCGWRSREVSRIKTGTETRR